MLTEAFAVGEPDEIELVLDVATELAVDDTDDGATDLGAVAVLAVLGIETKEVLNELPMVDMDDGVLDDIGPVSGVVDTEEAFVVPGEFTVEIVDLALDVDKPTDDETELEVSISVEPFTVDILSLVTLEVSGKLVLGTRVLVCSLEILVVSSVLLLEVATANVVDVDAVVVILTVLDASGTTLLSMLLGPADVGITEDAPVDGVVNAFG